MNRLSIAKPLLVVLPYHNGDFELAKQLVQWILELGNSDCQPHSLLFAADSAVPREKMLELANLARPAFHFTRTMIIQVPTPEPGKRIWAPNVMFMQAARQVQTNYKLPFLWLEPDCIPLSSDWLDNLAEEYEFCARRFMGAIIHQDKDPQLPADHLTGCGIYPNDAYRVLQNVPSITTNESAWDIGGASVVVPKSANTDLIHHFWGTPELPPVFVGGHKPEDPKNFVTLDFIRKGAVLFHRSKDGNLIKLLRAKRTGATDEPLTQLHAIKFDMAPENPESVALSEIGDNEQSTKPSVPAKTEE